MISPHFPPDSTGGTHRVRLLAPRLREHGWEPTVLTVDPRDYQGALDPALADSVPADLRVIRARAWPARVTRVSVAVGPVTPPDAPGASPSAPPPPPSPRSRLGTEGILRGDPMTDIASPEQRVPGVPLVTYDPPPPPEETSLPATGSAPPSDALPAPPSPAPPFPA